MTKPIEEYTDKELQKAIEMHEVSIRKDKETKHPNEELIKGTAKKEAWLKKLYEERTRRIKEGKYSP
jgi:hypothetical protein